MGEQIIVSWVTEGGKEVVNDILRLEERDTATSGLRDYCFCPEVLIEVREQLGLPVTTNGYRVPPSVISRGV